MSYRILRFCVLIATSLAISPMFIIASIGAASSAAAQNYTGRIGSAGSQVPSTTATTGETQNPRIGIAAPTVSSPTADKGLIIGTTIGHTVGD